MYVNQVSAYSTSEKFSLIIATDLNNLVNQLFCVASQI